MNELDIVDLYRRQIRQWTAQIIKSNHAASYFSKFIEHIKDSTAMCIAFDQRIESTILQMLQSFTFQVYSKDLTPAQTNPRRTILFRIVEILYTYGFISKQGYHFLLLEKQVFLKNKLKEFLEILEESQPAKAQMQCLWETILRMNMITFWNLMNQNHIIDEFLIQVYDKISKCESMVHDESILNYIQSIKRKLTPIQPTIPRLMKVASIRPRKTEKRVERVHMPEYMAFSQSESAQIAKKREYYTIRKSKLYEQIWFNSAKYKKYHNYIKKINTSANIVEIALTDLAFDEALFFNESHRHFLSSIHSLIQQIQKCLQNYRIISYQFFGSIRSTLALASEFDIDLTSIRSKSIRGQSREQSRQMVINTLFAIRKTLAQSNPEWVSKSFVYNFEKIKVPFLKIQFHKEKLLESFQIDSLQKLDITIGNNSAIKNSEMISYFARIPEITCFCLLVKLWAKTNKIINAQTPMKGLSSYGVVLMCLYYLMQTNQINFLQAPEDFDFEKEELTPNFDSCNMNNIEENFNGFLHFYKQTGPFQRERKVVCLLKNCKRARQRFDEDITFNMYDFIDKSNPGRLRIENKGHIFEQIDRAIKIMRHKNIIFIQQLIVGIS